MSLVQHWTVQFCNARLFSSAIAEAATARGWSTKVGNRWTARQVIATLRNPVYLGLFREGSSTHTGNHEPIIRRDLFDAVAERLESRQTRTP